MRTVSKPIVLGPITIVKTRAFVETVAWTVHKPNGFRYEELLLLGFILLQLST